MTNNRRDFLGSMVALGMLPLAGQADPRSGKRGTAEELSAGPPVRRSDWDVSWTDKLTGKHKVVFDNPEISLGLGLLRALVWIKDYGEVYGTTPAEMSGVTVLRHNAIWMIMNDEFWAHHKLGAMLKLTDPKTKSPVTRNPFLGPNIIGLPPAMADDTLKKVLASGPVLACNLAFTLDVVEYLKTEKKLDAAKAREMALAHVIPGVVLQPSGVFAVLRAQEAGCHYFLATEA